ncbi:unnamed protein product [Cuscuta epithymum]|uniref:Uncharacterized protein n=1 Tax=Cuscuta epithymum TaxID=186058 RepID=A0AAV0FCR3_9ASTE|nr:unnamed protein product [Cuscuta epithymum]
MDQYLGRTVQKKFKRFGVFTGTVKSYDSESGFFEVVYEDGDSEELGLSELAPLLEGSEAAEANLTGKSSRVGRKPKKRRLVERTGNAEANESGKGLNFADCSPSFRKTQNGGLNFNSDNNHHGGFNLDLNDGLNLNNDSSVRGVDLDLNINEGLDLNKGVEFNPGDDLGNDKMNLKRANSIPMNMDENGGIERNIEKNESLGCAPKLIEAMSRSFDLNLGLDEETTNLDTDGNVNLKRITICQDNEETQTDENGSLAKAICCNSVENLSVNLCGGLVENRFEDDGLEGADIQFADVAILRDGLGSGTCSGAQKGTPVRKRRLLPDAPHGMTDTVLRRSTRRAREALLPQDSIPQAVVSDEGIDHLSSPSLSVVSDEKITTSGHEVLEDQSVLPPKPVLPPSSNNLDLLGISVLDIFSLYVFLRSFSSILFLSPFELENFVASIKCSTPTVLFDSIHVSLLQMLRKHLETLSSEGSQSASKCLRSLNWDLLDTITWPIFMVEYLLMHSSGLKSGFDLCHLKLFECDYYKQSASVKIDILRCLCDDVIEIEVIRSELSKRTVLSEANNDLDQSIKFGILKKRRAAVDAAAGSCLTEELGDEPADGNSDECCLCKMDGNLICCDGCPAAFHSKCVGIVNSLLPEGDWFCPECVIHRKVPWMKVACSVRGAELVGIDPYGRLYFNCCSYLLVSDSWDDESSFRYYHRNDLPAILRALKLSEIGYDTLLNSISRLWDVSSVNNEAKSYLDSQHTVICSGIPAIPMQHSNHMFGGGNPGKMLMIPPCTDDLGCDKPETVNPSTKMESLRGCPEGPANVFQTSVSNQNSNGTGMSDNSELSRNIENGNNLFEEANANGCISTRDGSWKSSSEAIIPKLQCIDTYMNFYSFARTSSAIVEHLNHKPLDNKTIQNALKSEEEVISSQLKAISNKSTDFYWPNIQKLNDSSRKEKCGWCYSCRAPECERDCLFVMNATSLDQERFSIEAIGVSLRKNGECHLIDLICHILCMEKRLHGLLLGSWLNPMYSQIWQKGVLNACDVPSLRVLLLKLESNLRELALSANWLKHVDSIATLGSACHIVTSSSRVSSRHVIMKKKARHSEQESNPSSNAGSGLGLLWWRGGRLSRQIFSWKVLPRSLACKAARLGGCKKIPGVLYPDGSDFAKRSKSVAWKAAVETSKSVEQLALQVRDLDANIRWSDIENANILSIVDKEFQKSMRFFKKVVIRKKCSEGPVVKYLLDFGKRRFIPDIVVKYGSKLEESSSEKKKYWLEETYVPLHLLKGFEEKRIARKSSKMTSSNIRENKIIVKKPFKNKGFSYLFSKAEKAENYQCGHCNKGVLISEAVSCSDCKGFFHKRHVKRSGSAFASECIYTCHKCRDGKHLKSKAKKVKSIAKKSTKTSKTLRSVCPTTKIKGTKDKQQSHSQNTIKVSVVVPLRRSVRTAKILHVQEKKANKKVGRPRKKKTRSRKGTFKKPADVVLQKKRTQFCRIYWLNGLLLSQKPNDERVELFRRKGLIVLPGELGDAIDSPKCSLCSELESTPNVNYIACELCGDWFHGNAFGLTSETIGCLIGFKCHKCRCKSAPVCASVHLIRSEVFKPADLSDTKLELSNATSVEVKVPSHAQSKESSPEKIHDSDGRDAAMLELVGKSNGY